MAIDVTELEEYTTDIQGDNPEKLAFPDVSMEGAIEAFEQYLTDHSEEFGITSLKNAWHNFKSLQERADNWRTYLQAKIDRINGIKPTRQKVDPKVRKLRLAAKKFYEPMTEKQLRQHCELNELDYDSYESIEDIESALTEKYIAEAAK